MAASHSCRSYDYRIQEAIRESGHRDTRRLRLLHLPRIIDWGWYSPSTVLDDFSRYIIAWKLSRGNVISGNTVGTLFSAMEAPPTPPPMSATAR